jgi:hypothetical protein
MDELEMEERMTAATYQTRQRRAHGATPPGFPSREIIDEDPQRMEPADPDPGEDES